MYTDDVLKQDLMFTVWVDEQEQESEDLERECRDSDNSEYQAPEDLSDYGREVHGW